MSGEADSGGRGGTGESRNVDSRWRELMNQPDAAWKLAQLAAMLDPVVLPAEASDAINRAAELLHAGLERVELSLHLSESWKDEISRTGNESEWLVYQSQAPDDSFRQYLTKNGAPDSILKKGFNAHRNALLRHGITFNEGMIDDKAVFSLRPAWADKYIQAERDAKARNTKRRRQQAKKDEDA